MQIRLNSSRFPREWNRCHGAFLQIRACDLNWNLHAQNWLRYHSATLADVPVLWAEASAEGVQAGISANSLWLSLYGEVPAGDEGRFASGLGELGQKAGKTRVAIGGEEFHFFPGVPCNEPGGRALLAALRDEGYTLRECCDFAGELRGEGVQAAAEKAAVEAQAHGWTLQRVESAQDCEALGAFLGKEFPGRWEREWRFWRSRQDTVRAFWNILREKNGAVWGFSRLALRGRLRPLDSGWSPGALRSPLFHEADWRDTDSCLGPIGISAAARGRGGGRVLLGLSLRALNQEGAQRVCIDWTDARNFYAPLGLSEVRQYFSASRAF